MENLKINFTKRDILDSIEFYVENKLNQSKTYYFNEVVGLFLNYINKDIKSYKENSFLVQKMIKKTIQQNENYILQKYKNIKK